MFLVFNKIYILLKKSSLGLKELWMKSVHKSQPSTLRLKEILFWVISLPVMGYAGASLKFKKIGRVLKEQFSVKKMFFLHVFNSQFSENYNN